MMDAMSFRVRRVGDTEMLEQVASKSLDQLTPAEFTQARRNLIAREAFVSEFGSPRQLDLQAAALLEAEGRVFSVDYRGTRIYPRFQFDETGPLPAVANVLSILRELRSPWEIALWFTGNNGWLGGARPVDLLAIRPDHVIAAAQQEAEHRLF
jgi:hypothetical protein